MTAAARAARIAVPDRELIAAVARGDLEALGVLFERYEPGLRRYLGRMGIARSDADDLVQASFLEVVRASSRFDPQYSARSWLFGIASIMARRHRRSVGRAAARIATWIGLQRSQPSAHASPADAFESDQTLRAFAHAFERLAPKKREVFVLVTLEGLSGEEAASALGVPVNTVWTRLHHARRELRIGLAEHEAHEEPEP
jgi:RNA polymerase sigma-70 factor (ECF subfamily)